MRNLNVRLEDDQYDALRVRADAGGVSVSAFVRGLIDASGGSEVVPRQVSVEEPVSSSSGASLPPEAPEVEEDAPHMAEVVGQAFATPAEFAAEHAVEIASLPVFPTFLAAPLDECPLCHHDRQESDHLGGRPCKFKTSPRRNCGCTFEGF